MHLLTTSHHSTPQWLGSEQGDPSPTHSRWKWLKDYSYQALRVTTSVAIIALPIFAMMQEGGKEDQGAERIPLLSHNITNIFPSSENTWGCSQSLLMGALGTVAAYNPLMMLTGLFGCASSTTASLNIETQKRYEELSSGISSSSIDKKQKIVGRFARPQGIGETRQREAIAQSLSTTITSAVAVALTEIGSYDVDINGIGLALSSDGQRVYLADSQSGIKIFDVSNPFQPTLLNSLTGFVKSNFFSSPSVVGIAFSPDDGVVYVNNGSSLLSVNVSNVFNLTHASSLPISGNINQIQSSPIDHRVYLLTNNGMTIVNVSDHTLPNPVGEWQGSSPSGMVISAIRKLAMISDGGQLVICNTSNPTTLVPPLSATLMPYSSYSMAGEMGLNKDGTTVYVGVYDESMPVTIFNLLAFDVNDPVHVTYKNLYQQPLNLFTSNQMCSGMTVNSGETLIYLACGDLGIFVLDISHPNVAQLIGVYQTGNKAMQVATNSDETLAYVADDVGGLRVLRVKKMQTLPIAHWVEGSCVGVDGWAFAAQQPTNQAGVDIIDSHLVVDDRFAYITVFADAEMRIIDIRNSSNLVSVGNVTVSGGYTCNYGIAISKDHQWVFVGDSNLPGLDVINMSNPSQPLLNPLSPLNTIGSFSVLAQGIALSSDNQLAFVSTQEFGLTIFNVSNPLNPVNMSSTNHPSSVSVGGVLNAEGTLYFQVNEGKLQIIDVTNPQNPSPISELPISLTSLDQILLNKEGSLIYLLDQSKGVQVIDVSKSANPILKAEYLTPGGGGVAIALNEDESMLFLAKGGGGLDIIDMSDPFSPTKKGSINLGNDFRNVASSADGKALFGLIRNQAEMLLCPIELGQSYFSVPTTLSAPFSPDKAVLRVGLNENGFVSFFQQNGVPGLGSATIDNVYMISPSGERQSVPFWFVFSKDTYVYSGTAPKEWNNQRLILETQILNGSLIDYVWSFLYVQSSLMIDASSPKLSIQSPASLASLTIQLSHSQTGQFVLRPFGAVSLSYDQSLGRLDGIGTILGLNKMFQSLRFSYDNSSLATTTTVDITVDDSLNVPQTITVGLDKFIQNQPPYVSHPLANQTFKMGMLINFVIPLNTFADPYGDLLSFSATQLNEAVLPPWLNFYPSQGLFDGTTPKQNLTIFIQVNASDGYLVATSVFALQVQNHAPSVPASLPPLFIKALSGFDFAINHTLFSDADNDQLEMSIASIQVSSLKNGVTINTPTSIPSWLSFDSKAWMFSAGKNAPPIETIGNIYSITLSTSDGIVSLNTEWMLGVSNHSGLYLNSLLPKEIAYTSQPYHFQIPNNTFIDADGDPMTYSVNTGSLPVWLKFNGIDAFDGKPTVDNLGLYSILVVVIDDLQATSNATLTVEVVRSPLDVLAYVSSILGPIISGLGVAFTAYKKFPFLWNAFARSHYYWAEIPFEFLDGQPYTPQWKDNTPIQKDDIKQVRVVWKREFKDWHQTIRPLLPVGAYHNLVKDPIPSTQGTLPIWLSYNHEATQLQFYRERVPTEIRGVYTVQVLGEDERILQEMDLDFGKILDKTVKNDTPLLSIPGAKDGAVSPSFNSDQGVELQTFQIKVDQGVRENLPSNKILSRNLSEDFEL